MVYLKLNHTGLQADQGASRTNDCSMTSTALQWAVLARKVTPVEVGKGLNHSSFIQAFLNFVCLRVVV